MLLLQLASGNVLFYVITGQLYFSQKFITTPNFYVVAFFEASALEAVSPH